MSTHTPIVYWLSMPWTEACDWLLTVAELEGSPAGDV
jgi:hypothetical protein